MIQAGRTATLIFAGLLASAAVMGWAAGVETRLYVNGKVASTDVIMKDGRAYVPLKDVAEALGMVVVNKSDGFALTPAGGAGQVGGLNGKVAAISLPRPGRRSWPSSSGSRTAPARRSFRW